MKCLNCGAEIPDQAVFCPACGVKAVVPPALVCRQCQAPLLAGAKFCNNCGTLVSQIPAPPANCPQCRAAVRPDELFCPNCGSKLQVPVFAGPVQPVQPYVAQPYSQPYAAQPYSQPYNQPYGQPPVSPPAPPRRRRSGLLIGLALVLVAAIVIGVFAFGKQLQRLVMSPKSSYVQIEGEALRQQSSDLITQLAMVGNQTVIPEKGGFLVDAQVNLADNINGIDPALAATLENIKIQTRVVYDSKTPKYYGTVDLMVEQEKLLTLDAYYGDKKVVIGLPGILEKYLSATEEELTSLVGSTGTDTSQATTVIDTLKQITGSNLAIDEEKLKGTADQIVSIVLKHIDSVEVESGQSLTAGGVTATYSRYTMTIGKQSVGQMLIEILELLKDDQEVYNIVSKLSPITAINGQSGTAMTLKDYQAALDSAIEQITTSLEDETDQSKLVQVVYVNSKDEIFGRDLVVTDKSGQQQLHVLYAQPVDGDKTGIELTIEMSGQPAISITGSYVTANNKKTGSVDISSAGSKVAAVTFKDLETKKVGNTDRLLGEVNVTLSGLGASYTGPSSFSFKGAQAGDQYQITLGIPEYGSITIGYTELAAADVTFPTYQAGDLVSVSDQEALQGLMTEEAMNKLTEIVQRLGLAPATN
jgi:hypothetical protein